MIAFLHGLNTMGYALAGLFFLRFWRQTRDRFFMRFAAAFWLFAINYATGALFGFDARSIVGYVFRLIGFALIISAILSKNVGSVRDKGRNASPAQLRRREVKSGRTPRARRSRWPTIGSRS